MIFLSKFFYVFDIISDHHSKNTADTFILISIFDLISPKKKKTNRWNRGRSRQKTTRTKGK